MNRLQKELLLKFLFLCSLLATLYYFFWAAIYQFAFLDKPWTLAFMSSATNWVLFTVSLCASTVFWLLKDHPELLRLPKLPKIEAGKAKTTKKKEPEKEKEDRLPLI